MCFMQYIVERKCEMFKGFLFSSISVYRVILTDWVKISKTTIRSIVT